MWLKRFTQYLFRHPGHALALTFVSPFIPIFGVIGILITALFTLVKGVGQGAVFLLAATLPYVITFLIKSQGMSVAAPIFVWGGIGVAIISNILTWVFAVMVYRKTSWSKIFQIAALVGVLVVSVVHLAYPNIVDWWATTLQSYYNQASALTSGALTATAQNNANEAQVEAINITKYYATGLLVAVILFNALLQLVFARWWQAKVLGAPSLGAELHNIRLSPLAGILFIASLVLSYLGNTVVLDIMPVFYLLMLVAGLSFIHYLFSLMNTTSKWFWLTVLYITLIFTLPVSVLVVAMIALLDIWWDGRKKIKKI